MEAKLVGRLLSPIKNTKIHRVPLLQSAEIKNQKIYQNYLRKNKEIIIPVQKGNWL